MCKTTTVLGAIFRNRPLSLFGIEIILFPSSSPSLDTSLLPAEYGCLVHPFAPTTICPRLHRDSHAIAFDEFGWRESSLIQC